MNNQLEATKDNLEQIIREEAPSQTDLERKAELTLLSITERLPNKAAKKRFCKENNVPWDEYKLLLDKWKYVLKAYQDDASNQANGEMIATSMNLALNMEVEDG